MPTPAVNPNEKITIVHLLDNQYSNYRSTGSAVDFNLFSRRVRNENAFEGTKLDINNCDKKFINLKKAFKVQFESLKEFYHDLDFNDADMKSTQSLGSLLEMNPDIISMELTHDQSIFYTFKKFDYTFFIQHFIYDIELDEDEATLTIFKGDLKQPSFGGSLSETIFEIKNKLFP